MKMTIIIVQTTIELDFGDRHAAGPQSPPSPPGGRPTNLESSRNSVSFLELLRRRVERSLNIEPKEETVYGPFLSQ